MDLIPFQDSAANRYQDRAHDDKTCSDDTHIHLDYGDCQGCDICPWWILEAERNAVERRETYIVGLYWSQNRDTS